MKKASISFLMVLLCTQGVTQEVLSPDSHEQAAVQLIRLMNIEQQMSGAAEAMANVMVQQNPTLSPYRDVILEWAGSFMTWEVFGPYLARMYAEAFTEAELGEMVAFFQTSTGQKWLTLTPQMMNEQAQLGAREAQARQRQLQTMLRERAEELEGRPRAQ